MLYKREYDVVWVTCWHQRKEFISNFPFILKNGFFSRPSLRQSWSERSPACILSHQRWVMACHQPGMGHLLIGLGSDPFRLHFISFIFSKQVWFFFALIQVAIFKVFNVNALVNDVNLNYLSVSKFLNTVHFLGKWAIFLLSFFLNIAKEIFYRFEITANLLVSVYYQVHLAILCVLRAIYSIFKTMMIDDTTI